MIGRTSPQTTIFEESEQLISWLQARADASATVRQALARHQALHRELEMRSMQAQQERMACTAALRHRWECEVAGQRHYSAMVQQIENHYGSDSPQMQTVAPPAIAHGVTPAELLENMRRLHAALLLMDPGQPCDAESMACLSAASNQLEAALENTRQHEEQRRKKIVEVQLVSDACKRAMRETIALISEPTEPRHTANWFSCGDERVLNGLGAFRRSE